MKKENTQYSLVIDEVNSPQESLQILYLLAQKANKAGILDLNESSQVHGALVYYTKLVQQLTKSEETEGKEVQING